eukprot:scaffold26558_cov24-Prasinocladus_malaysianus.AAC.1
MHELRLNTTTNGFSVICMFSLYLVFRSDDWEEVLEAASIGMKMHQSVHSVLKFCAAMKRSYKILVQQAMHG